MSAAGEGTVAVSAAEKLQALRSVDCYPVPAMSVELIETHFAWVFLVGEYAYKMKKPVALPLLDLRSMEDRHRNCLEEVRLNRRLAPDIYLGACHWCSTITARSKSVAMAGPWIGWSG